MGLWGAECRGVWRDAAADVVQIGWLVMASFAATPSTPLLAQKPGRPASARRVCIGRRPLGATDAYASAPGMGAELLMKVQYESLLEEIVSRRQLHEAERGVSASRKGQALMSIRGCHVRRVAVRSCGMEALGAAQHRTKVKLRKAIEEWVSALASVTPGIQTCPLGSGDGCGVKLCVLTRGELCRSAVSGRADGDVRPKRQRSQIIS